MARGSRGGGDLRELGSPFSREVENLLAAWRGLPAEGSGSFVRGTKTMEDSIRRAMKALHVGANGPIDTLAERWTAIVGVKRAAGSHPVGLQREALVVAVSNPVLRGDLQMDSLRILSEVRNVPGCEGIRRLHLRAG